MGIMTRLNQLASEIYGEFGFSALSNFEKELVMSLYELEDAFDPTDLITNESDNIYE